MTRYIIIGTSQAWSYINSQLDRAKKYRVHICQENDHGIPLCGRGCELDETAEVTYEWFSQYEYACKVCLKRYHE